MPYAVDRVAASAPEASSRTTRPGTRPVPPGPVRATPTGRVSTPERASPVRAVSGTNTTPKAG